MDAYAMHLAMAALAGASFVAVSAYYMHCTTLSQLLEFAKTVERERDKERDDNSNGDSPKHVKKRRSHIGRRRVTNGYRRGHACFPDVAACSGGGIDGLEEKRNGSVPFADGIPLELPLLHTLRKGMAVSDFSLE